MNTQLSNADASFINEDSEIVSYLESSGAGDINGDGFDDIIIGGWMNSEYQFRAGQTYLIFGRSSGWTLNMKLSNANASFVGENENDFSGHSISRAGDVNGDGYDDILIGAYSNVEGGGDKDMYYAAGQTYLIFGKVDGWSLDINLSQADASFIGENYFDHSGRVSCAGDVNGDGYDDFLISAYGGYKFSLAGKTYLIFGASSGWSMDTNLSKVNVSFIGEGHFDYSGHSISGGGDVNGDGYDDIIIGAEGNGEGGKWAGQTYLIFPYSYCE
jgi:hypothetical protein